MPDTTTTELDAHTAALWREYRRLSDEIDRLTDYRKSVAERLRERCATPAAYAYTGEIVGKVQPTRSFDLLRAVKFIPADKLANCFKPRELDPALVKGHLTRDQIEQCMIVSGQPKLVRP